MKNSGVLVVLLCVDWILCIGGGGSKDELHLSEVSALRRDLVNVEHDLLSKLDIPAAKSDPEERRRSVSMIIEDYAKFGAKLDAMYPNTREQHIDVLMKSMPAWTTTETKLRDIDDRYAAFRRLQKITPVDENTWQNFSETILHDPEVCVVTTLFQVFDLVVAENLFRTARQVQDTYMIEI